AMRPSIVDPVSRRNRRNSEEHRRFQFLLSFFSPIVCFQRRRMSHPWLSHSLTTAISLAISLLKTSYVEFL
ncbi:hypothetical protein PFISCL1PPCAC_12480, partial [Pristionchus fissidentatus]